MPTSTARFVVVKIPGANHRFAFLNLVEDPLLKVQVRVVAHALAEIVPVVVID